MQMHPSSFGVYPSTYEMSGLPGIAYDTPLLQPVTTWVGVTVAPGLNVLP